MIELIPAIDLIDGKCVRLTKGDYASKKEYGAPVEMAKHFDELGFRRLHLVDLDGARSRHVVNLPVLERICNEIANEKIDIIEWDPDVAIYIAKALSPAKVLMVYINEDEKAARVIVPDNQLSLAIGKEGQNARLAAKLTGWKIDIKSQSQAENAMGGAEA